jgi:nicotinamide mononucleotide transporter
MLDFFSIKNIFFSFQGYEVSYLELFGTFFGLWAVILSAKEKVSSWYIGIVNVVLFFWLFYQSRLYSDMLLQIYFFVTNLMGWYFWTHPKKEEGIIANQLKSSYFPNEKRRFFAIIIIVGTIICGACIEKFHIWFPYFFQKPASFPYLDTFVMVASIVAQYLLTKKKIESWALWIVVDVVATAIYFQKNLILLSAEYVIFFLIAIYGFYTWYKEELRASGK